MNDSGGIDSDGERRRSASGEIVREKPQYGHGEYILTHGATGIGQQAGIKLREKDIGEDLFGRWAVRRRGEKGEAHLGMA